MPRIIWDTTHGNPVPYVSKQLGISEVECSDALHQIKQSQGLGGRDAIIIYDNGDVFDALNGEPIGNLYDEI